MRGLAVVALLCWSSGWVWGQTAPLRYWVAFTDKLGAADYPYSLEAPEAFLSARSLDRRERQGIDVDASDLPVAPAYVEAVEAVDGFEVVLASKWLNAVTVRAADSTVSTEALSALPFVSELRRVAAWQGDDRPPVAVQPRASVPVEAGAYGKGWVALDQLNGQALHGLGFRGEGLWIAVLDAGFDATDRLPVFERMFDEGRLVRGIDAMRSQGGLFAHHRHGTSVLGTMAGWWPDSLIGTAPDATYVLYRTEDAYSENLIEEDYWVRAAEHADSLGVDLMNTSLGYSLFDHPEMDHTWDDLDGQTTHIARGMSAAAEKGILCVTSAGNSGASAWHRITTPADARGILAVGAVDAQGVHAPFSGFGPSADGRVKPEVMALGLGAAYPTHDTLVKTGNGTSFASPILCGLAACLWQSAPQASAADIRWAIIESAHLATAPNDSMGYGIPDFGIARELLVPPTSGAGALLEAFPNPTTHLVRFTLHGAATGTSEARLYALSGELAASSPLELWEDAGGDATSWFTFDVRPGAYVLVVEQGTVRGRTTLIVQ